MTPTLTLIDTPTPTDRTVVRLYRRYVRLPLAARLAIGFGMPMLLAALFGGTGVLAWVLLVSVVTDLSWRRILNVVTGPALIVVGGLHALGWTAGLPTAANSGYGLLACFGLMLVLYMLFRGGEGDLKLAAVIGTLIGPYHGVEAVIAGYLLAAALSMTIVTVRLTRKALGYPTADRILAGTLPMAPFFAAGVVFTLVF